jgi:formylglycine-generating enzyme required for sulfatase activity
MMNYRIEQPSRWLALSAIAALAALMMADGALAAAPAAPAKADKADKADKAAEAALAAKADKAAKAPARKEKKNAAAGERVVRGGAWADRPFRATSAFRLSYPKWQKVYNVGFRVICPAKQ